jgi:hypothetical protein
VSGFLRVVWFHLPIKLTSTIAEIVLKVALNTTTLILLMYITLQQTYEDTEWAIKNSKSMNTLCNGQYDKQWSSKRYTEKTKAVMASDSPFNILNLSLYICELKQWTTAMS